MMHGQKYIKCITCFRRGVYEIFSLLVYYAASIVSYLPTFRGKLSIQSSRFKQSKETHKDVADRLNRHVGKQLPIMAA